MIFTNNLTVLFIVTFFALYFFLYELRKKPSLSSHEISRSKFIAVASLLFYATWYPPAILLLLYHTFLGYLGGRKIASSDDKFILWITIIFALLPLLFFKYYNFFITTFFDNNLEATFILPLGISFYTFSMIGYYVDIYNKRLQANQKFLEILLFISFWPHLASGPILRAKNIFYNTFHAEVLNKKLITLAFILIGTGLVKKLLIADNIGAYVNWNLSYGVVSMSFFEAWATMLGFAVQIYADFSGYSDMAIGFALLMGFKLPANFNYPYRASTVTEFWHRWHISLSTWFRDYVYFPLGGNKKGAFHTYLNIMIVFILSGIWHGVGWGFFIWGALHGFILVIEKLLGTQYLKVHAVVRWFITILLISVAWSFFRLNFQDALIVVQKMFGFSESMFFNVSSPYYVGVLFLMLIFPILDHLLQFYTVDKNGYPAINNNVIAVFTLSFLLILAFVFSGDPLPFIYFEF